MKKEKFFELLKESLEIGDFEINENTDLRKFDEFDSLGVLSLVAMIDENLNKQLSTKEFTDVSTVKSLMEKIGEENFI